jgi:CRP-like cAMP-binding protein
MALIETSDQLDLYGRAPSVAQALASSLAVSLRRLTEEASDLVFLDLPRRVAKALLSQPRNDDGAVVRAHRNTADGRSQPYRVVMPPLCRCGLAAVPGRRSLPVSGSPALSQQASES